MYKKKLLSKNSHKLSLFPLANQHIITYLQQQLTDNTNFKDEYYAHIQGVIPTPSQIMEIPKGGIYNELIEYEYKKIAESEKIDGLVYQQLSKLKGLGLK